MKIYLAGLDSSHLVPGSSNGYTQAARLHQRLLVSFFFYVDELSHARISNDIIPQPKERKNEQSEGLSERRHRRSVPG